MLETLLNFVTKRAIFSRFSLILTVVHTKDTLTAIFHKSNMI